MGRITTVHVSGPKLLAVSLCSVLNTFSDIAAYEAAPRISVKDPATAGEPPAVLLVALPSFAATSSQGHTGGPRRHLCSKAPIPRWASPFREFRPSRVVLVLRGTAGEVAAASALGYHIFVGIDDAARIAVQAILSAARSEPYCSPSLVTKLAGVVKRRASPKDGTAQSVLCEGLTERERNVSTLAAAGFSNVEIAAQLSISRETVKSHLKEIYKKLGIHRRGQIRM